MNILIITPFYSVECRPDLFQDTSVVHYFAKYWTKNNRVKVLNIYPHSYKNIKHFLSPKLFNYYCKGFQFEKDGVSVQITEVQKYPGQKSNYSKLQTAHIIKQFKNFIINSEFVPDVIVIHVPTYSVSFLDKIRKELGVKIPTIGVIHQTDIDEINNRKGMLDFLNNNFDHLYCRSNGIYNKLLKFNIKPLSNTVINSGIPLQSAYSVRTDNIKEGSLKVLYVGKLIKRKNVDKIIDAVKTLEKKDIKLRIIGTGAEEKKLRHIVQEYNIEDKVAFLGQRTRSEVLSEMAKSDVFCMPSINETLGLTYLESMSVGCVPIGTRGEGVDGIIINGFNGFLVNSNNIIAELVELFDNLIVKSKTDYIELSANAKQTVLDYEEEKCAMDYLEVLNDVVRQNKYK